VIFGGCKGEPSCYALRYCTYVGAYFNVKPPSGAVGTPLPEVLGQ